MNTSAVSVQHCPSCRADGDYGEAVEGITYRCPACLVSWTPLPDLEPVRTPVGTWLQRLKVRLTSRF